MGIMRRHCWVADTIYGFRLRLDSHPRCLTMVLYEPIEFGSWRARLYLALRG
jgi:hypothetical protein